MIIVIIIVCRMVVVMIIIDHGGYDHCGEYCYCEVCLLLLL